jgi:hypothetical protein
MDDTSEVLIDKSDNGKMSMIAAYINLCATGNQSISSRMDEPVVLEDRDIVRTAGPFHGKCANRFRGWLKSAINSHIPSESDKQWQDIIAGSPQLSSGSERQTGFMRIEERMTLGISDHERIRNSPRIRSSSLQVPS